MNSLSLAWKRFQAQSTEWQFFAILIITSAFKLVYLGIPNLVPQEAYYWTWSKYLDLSYFDHPPFATYSMAVFTRLFGDHVFWIRFPVWLMSIADALAIYGISRGLGLGTRPALWTLAAFNLAPLFLIGSTVMTPDVPMIVFWLLFVLFIERATRLGRWADWLAAGACMGFGLLSKYPAALLAPATLLFLLLSEKDRHWLTRPHPYLSVLPALIVFSPVVIWNSRHEWVSFLFQSSRRAGEMALPRFDYFLQFLSGQMGVLNPLILGCFIFALFYSVITKKVFQNRSHALLFSFSAVPFALCCCMAMLSFVKMNWPAPAYPTGFLLTAIIFIEKEQSSKKWRRWPVWSFGLGLIFMVMAYLLPATPLISIGKGDTWTGWPALGKRVSELRNEMEKQNTVFVFGNEYKVCAETWFYSQGHRRTYAQNVLGQKALQFDYFPQPNPPKGADAIFVVADFEPFGDLKLLESRFTRVRKGTDLHIRRRGKTWRTFEIYQCYGYLGGEEEVPAVTNRP